MKDFLETNYDNKRIEVDIITFIGNRPKQGQKTKMVLTTPPLNVIFVKQIEGGEKMTLVTKLMTVGGSLTMVVPPLVIKEMELLKGELMVINCDKIKMDIRKLKDIITIKDKIGKGEKVE